MISQFEESKHGQCVRYVMVFMAVVVTLVPDVSEQSGNYHCNKTVVGINILHFGVSLSCYSPLSVASPAINQLNT